MRKRTSSLQTVDEDKVCISIKVEGNKITSKTKDPLKQEKSTTNQRNKKKTKKKTNKFKDEELNQKYELLPKKARKAPFGRCYFAIHRDSKNVVLIAMIFQKVFDQFVQGGRGEDELHELMKAADPNLCGLREKIQCAGAVALIMDISSNEKTDTATRVKSGSSSSSSSSHDAAISASKLSDNPTDNMPSLISESNTENKVKKTKREKETRSRKSNTAEESTSNKETSTLPQPHQDSEARLSLSKDHKETRSHETANEVEAAQESSWTSWFMPWTTTSTSTTKPAAPTSNLFQQASERDFYLAETTSVGPYDIMMKKQEKRVIESNYYRGEAWSVVSPGYSDCDLTSRAAPPTSSTIISETQDGDDDDDIDVMKRIQLLGDKIQQEQKDDEADRADEDRRDERVEKAENEERINRRIDPEGSHQIDPSFSAKPKEVDPTGDEPTKDDTRISIAAALETRRKATQRKRQDKEEPQEKRMIEKEEVTTLIVSVPETKTETKVEKKQNEEIKKQIKNPAKEAMSLMSTETVYSADYSSVSPYRLMRPRNLTLCKLITSLELADCMPLGPYDHNVDYDEIFSVEENRSEGWFRRRETFYSGDSRSFG